MKRGEARIGCLGVRSTENLTGLGMGGLCQHKFWHNRSMLGAY